MTAINTDVRHLLPVTTPAQRQAASAIGKGLKALGYQPVRVAGEAPGDVFYLWLSEICEALDLPMRPEYEGAYITVRKL